MSSVRERRSGVYWNGENIDRYFWNEAEMAFANRSHPVPDVGKCLAFKSLKPLLANEILPLILAKALQIGEIDLQKR